MSQHIRTSSDCSQARADCVRSNRATLDELVFAVYGHLRRMSARFLRRERQDHTLQPTALANEVYLQLVAQRDVHWQDPAHLLGLATQMMRRILVNHAEARNAAKRGPASKIPLDEARDSPCEPDLDILALHDALTRLAIIDPEKSRIVELRFFGGLTMKEVSPLIGKSVATVEREWSLARAWLYREVRCR